MPLEGGASSTLLFGHEGPPQGHPTNRGPASAERRTPRAALWLLGALGAIAALAWLATILSAQSMGSAMMVMMVTGQGLWGVATFLGFWAVMMVAMMFPAAAGMVRTYVGLTRSEDARTSYRSLRGTVFVAGYVGVWAAFGLAIAGLYALLTTSVPDLAMSGTLGPRLAGSVLVLAGVYQFTPLKSVCLRACQSPFTFLMTHWRSGVRGAVSVSLRHAAYCVGCCWALFLVLFAVGVMSLPWMALLAVVVFAEKSFPRGDQVARGVGVAFLVFGATFLLWPGVGSWALG